MTFDLIFYLYFIHPCFNNETTSFNFKNDSTCGSQQHIIQSRYLCAPCVRTHIPMKAILGQNCVGGVDELEGENFTASNDCIPTSQLFFFFLSWTTSFRFTSIYIYFIIKAFSWKLKFYLYLFLKFYFTNESSTLSLSNFLFSFPFVILEKTLLTLNKYLKFDSNGCRKKKRFTLHSKFIEFKFLSRPALIALVYAPPCMRLLECSINICHEKIVWQSKWKTFKTSSTIVVYLKISIFILFF